MAINRKLQVKNMSVATLDKKPLRGPNAVYSSGDRYNYLMLTGKCYMRGHLRYVECICDCGKIWFTAFKDISSGMTKSCGCKKMQFIIDANTTHGMCYGGKPHPIYRAWHAMEQRCKGAKEDDFNNYTARGIVVCEEWKNDFDIFHKWALENGWKKGLSLDRINNDGNYEPSNCRWATDATQTRNTRQNVYVEAFGEKKCLMDWANDKRSVVSVNTLKYRLSKMKMKPEDAISNKNPVRANAVFLKYNGEERTLSEWCLLLKLPYKIIHQRVMTHKMSVDYALNKPIKNTATNG